MENQINILRCFCFSLAFIVALLLKFSSILFCRQTSALNMFKTDFWTTCFVENKTCMQLEIIINL